VAGGHAVALPPNAAPETVRALRRGAGWSRCCTTRTPRTRTTCGRGRGWRGGLSEGPGPEALAAIAGDRVIATVYTSGSTGAHQACPKTAAQLLGEAAALVGCFGVAAGQRVIATVPPHHLYGLLFSVLVPLAAAASFVRDTPLHAETVAAVARRWRRTCWSACRSTCAA
jgi:acyl-coenzyme A synthetase/AMP-(fatty) acid ligase